MATEFDPHVAAVSIERLRDGLREAVRDELAVEEPLEIRVDGEPLAVTMRTPGEDEELAAGFLAGEGLIGGPEDITQVGLTEDFAANTVEVRTKNGLRRDPKQERSFYLTSSCGVCGKGALEFVSVQAPALRPATCDLRPQTVLRAPDAVRANQPAFDRTGGLHATGLFEANGELLVVREDVGRHNAMDKAIGSLLLSGRFPLEGVFAAVSGRASFELVQKASLASLIGVVAVGPPSTLAVDLARERGMLLCGFVRGGSLNVYAGSDLLRA
ncbi:MAG TPA: formate dehydrogenase accessory sulfurtransferase FdhD [Thermoleophilaceae bacterium]